MQEADELHPRDSVEALYRCLASLDKRLIASLGRHDAVPASAVHVATEFIAQRLLDDAARG